jgi:hypothetical protein
VQDEISRAIVGALRKEFQLARPQEAALR